MPAKDHSIWDVRLSWPFRAKEPRSLTLGQRAQRRAGVFEAAAKAAVPPAKLDALRVEAERRRSRLTRGAPNNLWNRARSNITTIMPLLLIVLWMPMTAINLAEWRSAAAAAAPASKLGWIAANSVLFIVMQGAFLFWSLRRNFGILHRAVEGRCPDCNYDLKACPREPAFDPTTLGVDVGPARCPECGAFWPLVPPSELGPVAQAASPEPPCSNSSIIEDGGGR